MVERPIKTALQAAGVYSVITVPWRFQRELIGVLNLGGVSQSAFSEEHEDIAQEVGNKLAIAIQQAR